MRVLATMSTSGDTFAPIAKPGVNLTSFPNKKHYRIVAGMDDRKRLAKEALVIGLQRVVIWDLDPGWRSPSRPGASPTTHATDGQRIRFVRNIRIDKLHLQCLMKRISPHRPRPQFTCTIVQDGRGLAKAGAGALQTGPCRVRFIQTLPQLNKATGRSFPEPQRRASLLGEAMRIDVHFRLSQ